MDSLPEQVNVSGWGFWMQGFNGVYKRTGDNVYCLAGYNLYGVLPIMTNYLQYSKDTERWGFYRCVDIFPMANNLQNDTPFGMYDNGVIVTEIY